MANDYILKLKQLSPAVQAKLSEEKLLAQLDDLETQYGIKAVLILLDLLLGDIDYSSLADKLKADYGFNDFLASEIKGKFGGIIKILGEGAVASKPTDNIAAAPVAPITFSRADEDEVKQYINAAPAAQPNYTEMAKNLISAFGYQNQDEVVVKRLENIIVARVRDIRDDLETRENLLKSKKVGGMEFSEAEADRLISLIRNKPNMPLTPMPARTDWPIGAGVQPTIEMEDGLPVVRMPEIISNQPEVTAEPKIMGTGKLLLPVDDVKIKTEEKEILPPPTPQPFIAEKIIPESVLNAKTASRPNLDDVKLEKRLMGPIEELETMTIIDFRRLAADPQTAVNKIKEKIDLLESDSFNQKIAGIMAWQKSEVCKFYRMLGQLSMSDNKNIEEIIKERLMSGKPTLSLDEFHAVMELNKQLRY